MQTDAFQWGALSYLSEEAGRRSLERIRYRERNPFSSLSGMVLVLEELMDLYETLPDTQPGCRAETPDVELEILFRQNYSWQGRFRRPGDPGVTTFHSVLELLILLETALEQ